MTPFKYAMTQVIEDVDFGGMVMFIDCRNLSRFRHMSSSRYCKLVWRGIKYGFLEFKDKETPDNIVVTEKGRKYANL